MVETVSGMRVRNRSESAVDFNPVSAVMLGCTTLNGGHFMQEDDAAPFARLILQACRQK